MSLTKQRLKTIVEDLCMERGEYGYANPPIRHDLLAKSAVKISAWIWNLGKNILITREVQNPGPKHGWICNPLQFAGPGNPLKSRFESKIRERYFQNPPIRLSVHPPLYDIKFEGQFSESTIRG